MLKIKKPIALLLTACMAFSLVSCSTGNEKNAPALTGGFHVNWLDSGIFENIDKMGQVSISDDFAAAVNYEWAKKQVADFAYPVSSFGECMKLVSGNIRSMIADDSYHNKNIDLVRAADKLYSDWDYRNSLGIEPFKKYLGYIDDIKTIDDVSSYMLDNEKNPFAISFVKLNHVKSEAVDGYRVVMIEKPSLTLGKAQDYFDISEDAYKIKDRNDRKIRYLLGRCGYSEKQIKDTILGNYRMEAGLVQLDFSTSTDYTVTLSRAEVTDLAGNYPFTDLLKHYSVTESDHFMGETTYLDKLETIYVQKNVEDMKAFFRARLVLESIGYLDREAFDFSMDANVDRSNKFAERNDISMEMRFFGVCTATSLTAALNQAYLDYYYDENVYNEVKGFINIVKEKYKGLIEANENLSDTSKKALYEKLDKMRENVILPSNKADFTTVDFKTKEDGGSILDIMCDLYRIENEHVGEMTGTPVPRGFWDIYDSMESTTLTGATYDMRENAIYIKLGILVEPMYSANATIEQKLGSFVSVLGHEISHAFDTEGIKYDADGKLRTVVSTKEMTNWLNVIVKIGNHFDGYSPFEGSGAYENSGIRLSSEVIADAEGLKVAMMIAKDYEKFDYDLFFRSYAVFWRCLEPKQDQMRSLVKDSHPLEYLRINYTLVQFDEFVETYGIKKSNGMYMDPSERILIW